MTKMPLTQGKFTLIDERDYWLVRDLTWHAYTDGNNWYACAHPTGGHKHSSKIKMHQLLAGFPPFQLDHKNRNGLDNRRSNLRPATGTQNQGNSRLRVDNTSGIKGVYKRGQKWIAQIGSPRRYLGIFATEEEAHIAYCFAALLEFGEFAYGG